jgi:hypothetical protein
VVSPTSVADLAADDAVSLEADEPVGEHIGRDALVSP